jgi:acetyl-CoA acetyltransferase
MAEAFLIGGARTPVGRYGGSLSSVRPLGSSGSRLVVTLLGRMERELATDGRKLGLATMCVGVGQGTALLLEGV